MLKRIITAISLLLISASCLAGNSRMTYKNSTLNFSINYPKNWEIETWFEKKALKKSTDYYYGILADDNISIDFLCHKFSSESQKENLYKKKSQEYELVFSEEKIYSENREGKRVVAKLKAEGSNIFIMEDIYEKDGCLLVFRAKVLNELPYNKTSAKYQLIDSILKTVDLN